MVMDDKSKVDTITFFDTVDGDIYPDKDLPENARKLRGFVWRGDERIKTKEEIYPPDEVELDKKVVEGSNKKYEKENSKVSSLLNQEKESLAKYEALDYKIDENFKPKNFNTKTKITLDVNVPLDDQFQIYFTQDNTFSFNEWESEKANIKGSKENQKIVFYLPDNLNITNIRIDPGENPNQGEIKINQIEIENGIIKFKIVNEDFFNFFEIRNDLKNDKKKGTIIHTITKKNSKIDPILFSNARIAIEFKKLFKKKD
jgi:hypothetical protein